jgi:hypothetical protein
LAAPRKPKMSVMLAMSISRQQAKTSWFNAMRV